MDRSTPGLPVQHQLLELAQTHVHRVSDAIRPSHPVSMIQALARASSAVLHPADSPLGHPVTEVRRPGDSLIIFSLTQRPACTLLQPRTTKFNSLSPPIYQIHWFLSDPSQPPESRPLSLLAWMSAVFPSIQHALSGCSPERLLSGLHTTAGVLTKKNLWRPPTAVRKMTEPPALAERPRMAWPRAVMSAPCWPHAAPHGPAAPTQPP